MESKIVLITGANSGIGKAAALRFAQEGHHVVMACRSLERGERARDEIRQCTGSQTVDLMQLDVASFKSIRIFAEAYRKQYPKLDILIHNAAYCSHGEAFRLSEDGFELAYAANLVAPFLLTQCLKESLKQSADARVLMAGSNIVTHFFDPKKELDMSYLHGPLDGSLAPAVYERYCQSKMALLMLTFSMARKLSADGIAVNTLQINGAKMSKETLAKFTWRWRFIARIQNLFFRPPAFMANHYYEITTSERFAGVSGKNINGKQAILPPASNEGAGPLQSIRHVTSNDYYPAYADNEALQEKVWRLCEQLTALKPQAAVA